MITERDKEIFDQIIEFKNEKGYAPTLREICKLCFISLPTARRHLVKLCEAGYIELTPRISRSIVIKIHV